MQYTTRGESKKISPLLDWLRRERVREREWDRGYSHLIQNCSSLFSPFFYFAIFSACLSRPNKNRYERIRKLNLPRHIVASLHVRTYSTKKKALLLLYIVANTGVCVTQKIPIPAHLFTKKCRPSHSDFVALSLYPKYSWDWSAAINLFHFSLGFPFVLPSPLYYYSRKEKISQVNKRRGEGKGGAKPRAVPANKDQTRQTDRTGEREKQSQIDGWLGAQIRERKGKSHFLP